MSHRILLIDESAMLKRIATNLLRSQTGCHEVVTAARSAEGFARACAGDIGLILLDYQIAGLAHAELCSRLWEEPRTCRIPNVLLVGHGVPPPALASLPPNVVATLTKPVAPEQMVGLVNTVVGLTREKLSLEDIRANLHPDDGQRLLKERVTVPITPPVQSSFVAEKLVPDAAPASSRIGEQASAYLSVGKVLLQGDTKAFSLAELLRLISDREYNGVLHLWTVGAEPSEVVFDHGRVLAVSTRDAGTFAAGAADALPAKVNPATVDDALAEQRTSGTPFLLTLGTGGLLSKATAVSLLQRFGQRHFARFWPQRQSPVSYEFRQLEALTGYALRLESACTSIDQWLLETTRALRLEDVIAPLRHEGAVGTLFHLPDADRILQKLALSEAEKKFLSCVPARVGLPKVAEMTGMSQEAAYLMLYRFRCLDVLGYRTAPSAFVMTPRTNLHRVLPLKR